MQFKPIKNVLPQIQPGEKFFFETPQMRDKYVQRATALRVEITNGILYAETQGREIVLGEGTQIDISA